MSWQQPQGGYNPNAAQYNPNAPQYNPNAGAYIPQQQPGGYYPQGGYNAAGGYNNNNNTYNNPNAGGYYPQGGYNNYGNNYNNTNNYQDPNNAQVGGGYRGGFNQDGTRNNTYNRNYNNNNNNNRGGYRNNYNNNYNNNQNSYNNNNNANDAGEYYPSQQQQQPQQQPQQQQQQQAPAAPAAAAPAKQQAVKFQLGGGSKTDTIEMPAKKKAATLSLGKKKKEEEAKAKEEAEKAEKDTAAAAAEKGKPEGSPTTATSAAAQPQQQPASKKEAAATDARSKMTPEELRAQVRREIAKQREQNKKTFVRDPRPHFNIVFCGHVDAGKSTLSGHLLMERGIVDEREMDKLRREAEQHHREGWEFAYVMDVSEEERSKGITRETGAAYFETEKRRVTVLDAPGHKAFVPSMIGGATQADVCVLVISSRTGEFETGFEKGGQTREHAMLVRTCGVKHMVCAINKMDEMQWSEERYTEIVDKLRPFLRQNGYDADKAKNLVFIPLAGLTGENLIKKTAPGVCDWYSGPTMMEYIDNLTLPESKSEDDVLCVPLVGSYKDDGKTFIYGKVESGSVEVGDKIQVLPGKTEGVVEGILIEATEIEKAYPGDNIHLRVRNIDENDIHAGYVATSLPTSLRAVEFIQARIVILEVRNIICAGSRFMLHAHAAQEEASVHKLLARLDKKTSAVLEKDPACAKAGDVVVARIELDRPMVLETHKDFDKLGRFMLREDGKTVAIGLITKLYESTHESLAEANK